MARSPSKSMPADDQRVAKVLRDLRTSSANHDLTILKLSEPISSALQSSSADASGVRTSDISTNSALASSQSQQPTPSSLEADLAHYQELFAKLRFSYVEQVTKEKFIRAIVGDPPLIVTPQDNADLEASNAEAKATLKALKTSVASLVENLASRGRDLAARHERVRTETALLSGLPARVEAAEKAVGQLRRDQQDQNQGGELSLPLAKTLALVEKRASELRDLDRQLEQLASKVPRKRKEGERLQAELATLEPRRAHSAAAAREAKRRKEDAAEDDDLETRGRWERASEMVLRQVLELPLPPLVQTQG